MRHNFQVHPVNLFARAQRTLAIRLYHLPIWQSGRSPRQLAERGRFGRVAHSSRFWAGGGLAHLRQKMGTAEPAERVLLDAPRRK